MKFSLQTLVAAVTVSSTSAMWGYWVPPLDEPGVSCEHKRIKIPNHGEYTCMTVGTGICRENGGYFGEWRFGIGDLKFPAASNGCYDTSVNGEGTPAAKTCDDGTYPAIIDPATTIYPVSGATYLNSKGSVCLDNGGVAIRNDAYADTTHICIGENIDKDYAKFSDERPYMFFYNEKTHTFLYQLVCDGAGTEGKLPQLKMVNNEDLADDLYVDYPVDITKFKKGTTADPDDNNELWNAYVDWNGYADDNHQVGQLAAFIKTANPYFCQEYVGINGGASVSCWDNDCTASQSEYGSIVADSFSDKNNIVAASFYQLPDANDDICA